MALASEEQVGCRFAGVDVTIVEPCAAVDLIEASARARQPLAVHLCNAYTLTLAAKDPAYAAALQHRSLNLPDGVPVGWFSRWQTGRPNSGPVRGPGLMRATLLRPGLSHFFLGGDEEVLTGLERAAHVVNPAVQVVGRLSPPYAPLDDASVETWATQIRDSGADIVWVGLGTPKQDLALAQLVDRVGVVLVGVGAAFDFLAGTKREAPERLRGTGLEWVYRLANEPRRLWRRYLIGNVQFLLIARRELRAGAPRSRSLR